MRDFSEVLRELRAEKKVSQKALGKYLVSVTATSVFMKPESTAPILRVC